MWNTLSPFHYLLLYSTSGLFQKWLNDSCNHLCTYVSHLNMVLFIFEYKQLSSWLSRYAFLILATTNEIHSSIELCSAKVYLGVCVNCEVYQYIPLINCTHSPPNHFILNSQKKKKKKKKIPILEKMQSHFTWGETTFNV